MTHRLDKPIIYRILAIIVGVIALATPRSQAFPVETYADSSALSEGRWVKVSVNASGIHRISATDLRAWGFSDPAKVRVYGAGGVRISDQLTRVNYVDDLPQVQSVATSAGVYFYAVGVEAWSQASTNRFVHNLNPFTQVGYYYLSDRDVPARAIPENDATGIEPESYASYFYDRTYHELDQVSLALTGHYLLGEDFRYTPSQTFNFDLVDRDLSNGSKVWMQVGFAAKTYGASSRLTFTANGNKLNTSASDDIKASSSSSYVFGSETTTRKEFEVTGDKLQLGIAHSSTATVHDARLDYITINYPRQLKLRNGQLQFWLSQPAFALSGATAATHVWDVTNPLSISEVKARSGTQYINEYTGQRSYVAWNEDGTYPSPKLVANVANQNLHALPVPQMVIFTFPEWQSQAERLAQYHLDRDSMQVAVVNIYEVYNEFSSGSPDPGAIRRMLKMLYDRGNESRDSKKLQYALLMGRSIFDNRRLTSSTSTLSYPTIPSWETNNGLDENSSYTTDDIYAFLADGSGSSMGSNQLAIAVGRMPVRSLEDAKNAVDKIQQYAESMPRGTWENRVMLIADDEDRGQHIRQTERFYTALINTQHGDEVTVDKVYIDAYDKVSNGYPGARADMFRLLDEGVWWWNYVGHANMSSWTHDNLLVGNDFNNMYYRRFPILYAATCDFLRWDQVNLSGAEIMWHTQGGGVIAAISATRPVYISDNGLLTTQVGAQLARRGVDGTFQRIGDLYRNAKNSLKNNSNKLRYVLMGDPAMPMIIPSNRIKVTAINGEAVDPANPPTIMARQDVTVEGEITDPAGTHIPDFTGILSTVLYDAEYSTTSHGWGDGNEETFEQQGTRLYAGNDSISGGKFKIHIAMPSEIADNYRPGALNLYARSDKGVEAISCMRDLYVYGTDHNAAVDTIPPVIESYYLNHQSFVNGQTVNESPMVLASISDNRGLNLSQAGIGHQMTLYLDDTNTMTNVSQYYTPYADGSIGGTIAYPTDNLSEGAHTLKLRVWDTSTNMTEQTLEFFVKKGLSPVIYDIYCDANPASVEANFYLTHDRPDAQVTVTVTVYNLLGAEVWSSTASGRSDMFTSAPVKWDLTGPAGNRVNRGIYLYKASITTDGEQHSTATRKLAVTAP